MGTERRCIELTAVYDDGTVENVPAQMVGTGDGVLVFPSVCSVCGNEFVSRIPFRRTCSIVCYKKYHNQKAHDRRRWRGSVEAVPVDGER